MSRIGNNHTSLFNEIILRLIFFQIILLNIIYNICCAAVPLMELPTAWWRYAPAVASLQAKKNNTVSGHMWKFSDRNMVEKSDIRVVRCGGSKINLRAPIISNDSRYPIDHVCLFYLLLHKTREHSHAWRALEEMFFLKWWCVICLSIKSTIWIRSFKDWEWRL